MSDYDDIINLPHHVSEKHPQMTMHQRAAQFAPFAALAGYGTAIEETTRKHVASYDKPVVDDERSDYERYCREPEIQADDM